MIELHPRIRKISGIVKKILSTDDGKYLLKCFKEDYGTQTIFSSDPLKMAYQLGQRELIEKLLYLGQDDLSNVNTAITE